MNIWHLLTPGLKSENHRRLLRTNLVLLGFGAVIAALAVVQLETTSDALRSACGLGLLVVIPLAVIYQLVAMLRGRTYFGLRIKELKQSKAEADKSKVELLKFAEDLKRRRHGK